MSPLFRYSGTRAARAAYEAARGAYHAKVGHVCPLYATPRSGYPHYDGLSDPAVQEGIGCPICYPPDGRPRTARLEADTEAALAEEESR